MTPDRAGVDPHVFGPVHHNDIRHIHDHQPGAPALGAGGAHVHVHYHPGGDGAHSHPHCHPAEMSVPGDRTGA